MSSIYKRIGNRKGETKEEKESRAQHALHYEGKHVNKSNPKCSVCNKSKG